MPVNFLSLLNQALEGDSGAARVLDAAFKGSSPNAFSFSPEARQYLRRAYEGLIAFGAGPQGRANAGYAELLNRVQGYFLGPTPQMVKRISAALFQEDEEAQWQYASLTPLGRAGFYLTLMASENAPEQASAFMRRLSSAEGDLLREILELIALVDEQGIVIPTEWCLENFKELQFDRDALAQALWLRTNTEAQSLLIAPKLDVDLTRLSAREIEYSGEYVPLSHLKERVSVSGHLLAGPADASHRLITIQTLPVDRAGFSQAEEAQLLTDIFLRALAAKQNRLSGVECVIRAPSVQGNLIERLVLALETVGLPYLIRLEGGTERRIIQKGLTYSVIARGLPQARLKPLPKPSASLLQQTLQGGVEDEHEEKNAQFKEVKPFLDEAVPDLRIRQMNSYNEFVSRMKMLRRDKQDELLDRLEVKLNNHPQAAEIKSRLRALRASRRTETPSKNFIDRILEIAVLADGREPAENGHLTEDILQAVASQHRLMESLLRQALPFVRDIVATCRDMLAGAGRGLSREDWETLRDELFAASPDTILYSLTGRHLNWRHVHYLMSQQADRIPWDATLARDLGAFIQNYDSLLIELEGARRLLPDPKAESIERVYIPLSEELRRELRTQVLKLGPVPKKKFLFSGPKTEAFDRAQIRSLYRGLILVHAEGDTRAAYYFPEDLEKIRVLCRLYLKQCAWGPEEIDRKLPEMESEELLALGASSSVVLALTDYLPASFQRTDLVEALDRFTGRRLDLTKIVAQLWRDHREEDLSEIMRAVVMDDGRRVYFVHWENFSARFGDSLWQMPKTDADFRMIFREEERLDAFLDALRAHRGGERIVGEEIQGDRILTGWAEKRGSSTVLGLFVLSAAENERQTQIRKGKFQIHFARTPQGKIYIRRTKTAYQFGIVFLEERHQIRIENPIVRQSIAMRWGEQKYTEPRVFWKDVLTYIANQGLRALWEAQCWAHPMLPADLQRRLIFRMLPEQAEKDQAPERIPVSNIGLFLPQEEVEKTAGHDTKIAFVNESEGSWIEAIEGDRALDFSIAYLDLKQGAKITSIVETAVLATLWGTRADSVSMKKLVCFCTEQGLDRIWAVQRYARPGLAPLRPHNILRFRQLGDGGILKIHMPDPLIPIPKKWAPASVDLVQDKSINYRVHRLEGGAGIKFAAELMRQQGGMDLRHNLEYQVLAASYGFGSDSFPATSLEFQTYLSNIDRDRLWAIQRVGKPHLAQARPSRTLLTFRILKGNILSLGFHAPNDRVLDKDHAQIGLADHPRHDDSWFFDQVTGQGTMEIVLQFLKEQKGIPIQDMVEKRILASHWDSRLVPRGSEMDLNLMGLLAYLGRLNPIGDLVSILRAISPEFEARLDQAVLTWEIGSKLQGLKLLKNPKAEQYMVQERTKPSKGPGRRTRTTLLFGREANGFPLVDHLGKRSSEFAVAYENKPTSDSSIQDSALNGVQEEQQAAQIVLLRPQAPQVASPFSGRLALDQHESQRSRRRLHRYCSRKAIASSGGTRSRLIRRSHHFGAPSRWVLPNPSLKSSRTFLLAGGYGGLSAQASSCFARAVSVVRK